MSDSQKATLCDIGEKFKKLEEDMAASQEDATERALKRARRDHPLEFKKKGQYLFNTEVWDKIESTAKKMSTLSDKDAKVAQGGLDELHIGIQALAECQKHIHIADQAKNSWRVVAAYKARGLGDSEEDNKKIKQADKDAEPEIQQPGRGTSQKGRKNCNFNQLPWVWPNVASARPPTAATAHATVTSPLTVHR